MNTMQSFYATLSSPAASGDSLMSGFLRIARASLNEILAVRSELYWDTWTEAK